MELNQCGTARLVYRTVLKQVIYVVPTTRRIDLQTSVRIIGPTYTNNAMARYPAVD